MHDTDGITLMTEWSAASKLTMPVVMLTAEGTIDTAVEAIRAGAVDFIEKPIALKKLLLTVERCLFGTPVRSQPVPERAVNGSSGTLQVPAPDMCLCRPARPGLRGHGQQYHPPCRVSISTSRCERRAMTLR